MFTLRYPPEMASSSGAQAGAGSLGAELVRIALPEGAFAGEKANYVEAYLVVSVASEPAAVAACEAFSDLRRASEQLEPTIVHGIEFVSRSYVEGAAGNRYESRVYRVTRKQLCYEVAIVVRTGNIGNYPPGTVHEFDRERAFAPLQRVFRTFRLIDEQRESYPGQTK